MTRSTNARLAGFTFLFYIAVAFPEMVLLDRATSGQGTAAKVASMAEHISDVRVAILLSVLSCFSAWVLAVTLYAITRDEDPDLALLAFTCRVGEGMVGAIGALTSVGLLWIATTGVSSSAPDAAASNALGAVLLKLRGWTPTIGATFFAVGSTLFSYLFLRGRMIPVALAWLGVVASVLLVVVLPLQLAGFLRGAVTSYVWLPMLVFEVTLALWLLIKGVPQTAMNH
jgi:hypothetical protein